VTLLTGRCISGESAKSSGPRSPQDAVFQNYNVHAGDVLFRAASGKWRIRANQLVKPGGPERGGPLKQLLIPLRTQQDVQWLTWTTSALVSTYICPKLEDRTRSAILSLDTWYTASWRTFEAESLRHKSDFKQSGNRNRSRLFLFLFRRNGNPMKLSCALEVHKEVIKTHFTG